MIGALSEVGADALLGIPTDRARFALWYRSGEPRSAWELVATGATHYKCVTKIGAGGRRNGRWLVLEAGAEP